MHGWESMHLNRKKGKFEEIGGQCKPNDCPKGLRNCAVQVLLRKTLEARWILKLQSWRDQNLKIETKKINKV